MVLKLVILTTCVAATYALTHSVSSSSTNVNGVGHSVTNTDGVVRGTYSAPDAWGNQRVYHYGDGMPDAYQNPWQTGYPSFYPQIPSLYPGYPTLPPTIGHLLPTITPNYPDIYPDWGNLWNSHSFHTPTWAQNPIWY